MSSENAVKRCAIVGTAATWTQTPWDDLSVDILTLNDGYALAWRKGWSQLPRHTVHFDLHPFAQMAFQPKGQTRVSQADVPVGAYLRPQGHLDWLRSATFPVFVNEKPVGWPAHVQTFPRQQIHEYFGTSYFSSTPAWMLAWAIVQGYTSIEIYGIHLATAWEYQAQRPNFEWWLALALGRGISIKLPERCPLMKAKHIYAYEPKPDVPLQAMELRIAQIKQEGARLQHALDTAKAYQLGHKADLQARLAVVNIELADARQAHGRVHQMVMA